MKSLSKNSSGFTLIELLVTIVIIGVLAGITLAVLQPSFFFGKGRDAHRQSDLQTVRAALEQYYIDNGRQYPASTADHAASYVALQTTGNFTDYLNDFPSDPGSTSYNYRASSPGQKCYELYVTLESSTDPCKVCGGALTCQSSNSFCVSPNVCE